MLGHAIILNILSPSVPSVGTKRSSRVDVNRVKQVVHILMSYTLSALTSVFVYSIKCVYMCVCVARQRQFVYFFNEKFFLFLFGRKK